MDDSKKNAIIKAVILMVLFAAVILGIFVIVNRGRSSSNSTTEDQELTEVQKITTMDLSKTYPKTPATVADLYVRIMKVMYKQTYTDEEFGQMADVMKGIFDDELIANQSDWPGSLKTEVDKKKEEDYSISKYEVLSNDIEETKDTGEEIANVLAKIYLRHGTHTNVYNYLFVLRKDADKNWKILGWTVSEVKDTEAN
ncbi:DUF6715 family protein [Butyrivibrio sp. WCD3002]|jgi:hypothetical protein|uniref:DUF6715 family protein n=1 Tax=Butyrivibrio sp. WCD3002 TaxID=1280676 RepID=UPI000412AE02|nr:DUF6715 family protein [Butyrivibrio sp. WCD3002]